VLHFFFLHARHVFVRAEIRRRLVDVYGEEVMSRRSMTKWCSDFKSGQVTTKDNERIGRLYSSQSQPRTKHVLKQLSWITEE
jgi:hypothetical protein